MPLIQGKTRLNITLWAIVMLFACWTALPALERDVVISVYQGPCKDGEFEVNLARAREVIQDALERKSDFLALPETFLSGYNSRQSMERPLGAHRIGME